MAGPARACPNGHPAVHPDQRFCETCGAAFALPTGLPPSPVAGPLPAGPPPPPVAPPPAPVAGPPPAGWPAPSAPGLRPPARRGPSMAVVLALVLLVAGAAGAAAFVLVAKPFGGGAASPAPSSVPAAIASTAPTAEATPRPTAPTPEPTPQPTPEPTATPTPASPEPSALPTSAATASCRSITVGITVTYPAGWFAYSGDARWTCLLFDPQPIDIQLDSELPSVAVAIFEETRPASAVAADFETASVYTILSTGSGTADGHAAVTFEVENTGQGYYEKGVHQTVVIVDRGSRGSSRPGDDRHGGRALRRERRGACPAGRRTQDRLTRSVSAPPRTRRTWSIQTPSTPCARRSARLSAH